jgi:hypothetical protein
VLWHQPSQADLLFSATGQRTIHHASRGSQVLLFVREHRRKGGRWRFAGGWSGQSRRHGDR